MKCQIVCAPTDLTLDTEHWSFKSDTSSDLTNPLHVTLPTGIISCSSPSPTRFVLHIFLSRFKRRIISQIFRCISISTVVALVYDFHLTVCHHRPLDARFKRGAQCRQLRCGQAHWARLNGNSNWMITTRAAIHRHHSKRSSLKGRLDHGRVFQLFLQISFLEWMVN